MRKLSHAEAGARRMAHPRLNLQNVRSFVQTSKLHPRPQYVQTVFVRRMRNSRMWDSAFRELQNRSIAVSGSTPLNHIDHAAQRCLWSAVRIRMPEHGFFHERVTRAHRDAVAAGRHNSIRRLLAAIPEHAG